MDDSAPLSIVRELEREGDVLRVATVEACLDRLRFEPWRVCVVATSPSDAQTIAKCLEVERIAVPLVRPWPGRSRQGRNVVETDQPAESAGRGRPIISGDLVVEPSTRDAYFRETAVGLTKAEFRLLYLLALRPNRAMHRRELAFQLGIEADAAILRRVDCMVCRLRRKLARFTEHAYVSTKPGFGYMYRQEVPRGHRSAIADTGAPSASISDLSLDERALDAYVGNRPLGLTRREFQVLALMVGANGETIGVDAIARGLDVSGPKARKAVTAHIVRLRGKLRRGGSKSAIVNSRGEGWSVVDARIRPA
jgi:DNA-binding response OmpR family regulator